MMHASALAVGWRSALTALAASHGKGPSLALDADSREPGPDASARDDDDLEPFHLDDEELARRLVKDRGLVRYSTPPHNHPRFPDR